MKLIKKSNKIVAEKEELNYKISNLIEERDGLRIDMRDIARARTNLIIEKTAYAQITNQKLTELENSLKKKNQIVESKHEEFLEVKKLMRGTTNERDKLKERIQKLKNKRLRVDVNQKLCKK